MSAAALVSLTPKEAAFLVLCLNYDTAEQQLGDNYSNGGIEEAADLFCEDHPGFSPLVRNTRRKAAGGLLASLTTKGLGHLDTEYDQFNLTEAGVHAAFAAKGGAA